MVANSPFHLKVTTTSTTTATTTTKGTTTARKQQGYVKEKFSDSNLRENNRVAIKKKSGAYEKRTLEAKWIRLNSIDVKTKKTLITPVTHESFFSTC